MQVKRYVAPNMRLALKMVREEIGPDAVILSSKRLEDGVEIMTAVETPAADGRSAIGDNPFRTDDVRSAPQRAPSKLEQELEQMQRDNQSRARAMADAISRQNAEREKQFANNLNNVLAAESNPGMSVHISTNPVAKEIPEAEQQRENSVGAGRTAPVMSTSPGDNEIAEMRRELRSMRDMFEQQLTSMAWGQYQQQQPTQASLWRRMKRMGLSANVSHSLLEGLPPQVETEVQDLWQFLMNRLAERLPVVGGDLMARGGVYALVGPTGAGKTTTIGKLATRYVLEHGCEQLALVTTDTVRIAAQEQLRTFGRILNVPVKLVDNHNSLERVLYSLRHKSLVLVDTAGMNRQDQRLQQQLAALNDLSARINTILTIPATSQKAVIKSAYHAFRTDNLCACILTKTDEASSIGEALSLAAEKNLPIAYSTIGQAIPDDIAVANSIGLVRRAIELARQVSTDDGVMAEEIASLARV